MEDQNSKKTTEGSDQDDFVKLVEAIKKGVAQVKREMISKRIRYGKAVKKVQREQK